MTPEQLQGLDALISHLFRANELLETCEPLLEAHSMLIEDIRKHLERCGPWREAIDDVHARAAPPTTSWDTLRRALGVVNGAPADALDDDARAQHEIARRTMFSREVLVEVLVELDANIEANERDADDCRVLHLAEGDTSVVHWALELARDGAWSGPPSEREVETIRRRAERAYSARRNYSALVNDDDTLWIERLGNGCALFLREWSYGGLQLCIGEIGRSYYDDTWYYDAEHRRSAWRAVLSWKGLGEPNGWTRHPATGRRRPDGTRESEIIRP